MQAVPRVQLHSLHDLTRWFCGLHSLSQPGPRCHCLYIGWSGALEMEKLLAEPWTIAWSPLLWPFKQAAHSSLFDWEQDSESASEWDSHVVAHTPLEPDAHAKDVASMPTLIFIPGLGLGLGLGPQLDLFRMPCAGCTQSPAGEDCAGRPGRPVSLFKNSNKVLNRTKAIWKILIIFGIYDGPPLIYSAHGLTSLRILGSVAALKRSCRLLY